MGVPTPGENQSGAEDVSRERPPLLERPPPPVGVALPKLADVLCFHVSAESVPQAALQAGDIWTRMCWLSRAVSP